METRRPRHWLRGLSPARRTRTRSSTLTTLTPPTTPPTPTTPTPPPPPVPAAILHRILNFAPHHLLLTFRCVSRQLRRKADALLAGHLVANMAPTLRITSPRGAVPGLTWQAGHDGVRSQILLYTKVLDIRGGLDAALQGLGLNHVPTVRFRENSVGRRAQSCEEGHVKLVVFATLSPDAPCPLLCPVPESARTLTATLRCLPGCPSAIPTIPVTDGLRDVVLICTVGRRTSVVSMSIPQMQCGLVATLAETILRAPRVRYTVVDVHLLDSANLGFPLLEAFGGRLEDGFARRKILEAVGAALRRVYTEEEIAVSGSIEFIESDEYRARVGEEVYRVETVEYARVSSAVSTVVRK